MNSAMRCLGIGALFAALAVRAAPTSNPEPPDVVFKDLFVAVQMQSMFDDSKAFPDATPRAAPQQILSQYHSVHPQSPDALRRLCRGALRIPEQVVHRPLPRNRYRSFAISMRYGMR